METMLYQDSNDDSKWKRFENDCDYPWDDSYSMSASEIEKIKRNLIMDSAFSSEKNLSPY